MIADMKIIVTVKPKEGLRVAYISVRKTRDAGSDEPVIILPVIRSGNTATFTVPDFDCTIMTSYAQAVLGITVQPQDTLTGVGMDASFAVDATGYHLSHQWYRVPPGATGVDGFRNCGGTAAF